MEATVGSAITPDYIGIIRPTTFGIGLTISENGSGEYYLYTTEDIEITNIEVKALFSGYTFNDDNSLILTPNWEENDSYTFSIGEIKKKGKNKSNGKYEHSVLIKLIDSPYIPNNSLNPLCLRLYIYYTLNGADRRVIVDTKNPEGLTDKGEHLVYHSNTYTKRKFWPYSIQLDSIYRPFFFNAALVFFDGNLLNTSQITEDDRFKEISGSTFARFYFSIANGCTIRDGVDKEGLPKYKIGDINLNINYLNKDGIVDPQSAYTLTIKDAYRSFSEIIEPGESGSTYYNAHIRGIRESGAKHIFTDYLKSEWGSTPGGMYLLKKENNDYLIPMVDGYTDLIPDSIYYYNKVYSSNGSTLVNEENIFSAHTFNNEQPLLVNFSVSDASIDGIDHKTIEVNCVDIRFPKNIKITAEGKVSIPYNDYNEEITYIYTYGADTKVIDNIFKILGKMNVNDYTSDKYRDDDIFNYLYFKHYGGGGDKYTEEVVALNFGYNATTKCFEAEPSETPTYVIGVYHGGYEAGSNNSAEGENDEETGDLLRYINHTNKLLIMRIYKL